MIGWELRELRLRVTKITFSKGSQMSSKNQKSYKINTDLARWETQRDSGELMENSGRLSEGLTGTHGELRELRPLILENSGSDHDFGRHPPRNDRCLTECCVFKDNCAVETRLEEMTRIVIYGELVYPTLCLCPFLCPHPTNWEIKKFVMNGCSGSSIKVVNYNALSLQVHIREILQVP